MSLEKYDSIPKTEYIKKVFFDWPQLNPGDILQMTLTKDGKKSTESVVIPSSEIGVTDQMGVKGRFYITIKDWEPEPEPEEVLP